MEDVRNRSADGRQSLGTSVVQGLGVLAPSIVVPSRLRRGALERLQRKLAPLEHQTTIRGGVTAQQLADALGVRSAVHQQSEDHFLSSWFATDGVNAVIAGPNNSSVLAHEIGHAKAYEERLGKALLRLKAAPVNRYVAGAGILTSAFANPDSAVSEAAPWLVAATQMPVLLSEAQASLYGHRALTRVKATSKELANYRKILALAWAGYLAESVFPVGAAVIARGGRKVLKRFGNREGDSQTDGDIVLQAERQKIAHPLLASYLTKMAEGGQDAAGFAGAVTGGGLAAHYLPDVGKSGMTKFRRGALVSTLIGGTGLLAKGAYGKAASKEKLSFLQGDSQALLVAQQRLAQVWTIFEILHYVAMDGGLKAFGPTSEGDRDLMRSIGYSVDSRQIGEKIHSYYGNSGFSMPQMLSEVSTGLQELYATNEDPFHMAMTCVDRAQALLRQARDELRQLGFLSMGLDDHLTNVSSSLESISYKLQQRTSMTPPAQQQPQKPGVAKTASERLRGQLNAIRRR